jgi:hypothetical protein
MSQGRMSLAALLLLGAMVPALATPAAADDLVAKPSPSIDDEFTQIALQIPGFGGLYRDDQGEIKAYMVDTGKAATALPALRQLEDKMGGAIEVKAGRYDWLQLSAWRDKVRLLQEPAVTFLDIDEAANRIRLGVDRTAADKSLSLKRLEHGLAAQGIPADAVIVEERDPARYAVNIDQGVRPVAGALQITWQTSPTTVGVCTLGYNACDAANRVGFITNSHCSLVQGGVPVATVYNQHLPALRIGVEQNDPAYPLCPSPPFPAGNRCRFSDSLFATYDAGIARAAATVYRTTFRAAAAGSLTIDPVNPAFTVTALAVAALPVGTEVNKIGRTTGWTFGPVSATCVDVQVGTTWQRCQEVVVAGVGGGDSGSPVFTWPSQAVGNITAAGLLWGQGVDGLGRQVFFYSRLGQIAGELGALNLGC